MVDFVAHSVYVRTHIVHSLTQENINTRTQVQQAALSAGAWISQDYVRKANAAFEGPFVMHGNTHLGYEVMPDNVALTVKTLRLSYEEWDYTSKAPQSESYLLWLKKHLARGSPVVFFPICKGDDHKCYATSSRKSYVHGCFLLHNPYQIWFSW